MFLLKHIYRRQLYLVLCVLGFETVSSIGFSSCGSPCQYLPATSSWTGSVPSSPRMAASCWWARPPLCRRTRTRPSTRSIRTTSLWPRTRGTTWRTTPSMWWTFSPAVSWTRPPSRRTRLSSPITRQDQSRGYLATAGAVTLARLQLQFKLNNST